VVQGAEADFGNNTNPPVTGRLIAVGTEDQFTLPGLAPGLGGSFSKPLLKGDLSTPRTKNFELPAGFFSAVFGPLDGQYSGTISLIFVRTGAAPSTDIEARS
jgi:hypothetical protein